MGDYYIGYPVFKVAVGLLPKGALLVKLFEPPCMESYTRRCERLRNLFNFPFCSIHRLMRQRGLFQEDAGGLPAAELGIFRECGKYFFGIGLRKAYSAAVFQYPDEELYPY